ncbi:MAG: ABC transporter permease, partial [Sphaerochaeta sp.]
MKTSDVRKQRTLAAETWRRFRKNKLALAGMIVLITLVLIALSTIVIDLVTDNAIYNN